MSGWVFLLIRFIASVVFVSLGQSSSVPSFSIAAAMLGIACFWSVLFSLVERLQTRFWVSALWFSVIQAAQLSWLTSSEYMGPLIWIVYIGLIGVLGVQFGCLVFLFPKKRLEDLTVLECLAISSFWVLLEWMRIYFFTGFTWNPIGLSLADSPYAIQFASLVGVYGLSFWVIFVNVFGLYGVRSKGCFLAWIFCALFPYLFGWGQQAWVLRNVLPKETLSVALVQTAILPEQKDFFLDRKEAFIPFLDQWARIWKGLDANKQVDLIVLPEAAVGAGAHIPVHPFKGVKRVWEMHFGPGSSSAFPPFKEPFAVKKNQGAWYVTNAFIAQAIANHFQAEVIIGFDDQCRQEKYNAAFHFSPQGAAGKRYIKRVLVPVGEYIPLSNISWISQMLLSQFGVADSFVAGKEAAVYEILGRIPLGVSICLEETYGNLIRDLRILGAELLVNVTNDVWFPHSKLPMHHFQHGRIRAAENGVSVIRASNTGVSGVINCFGNVLKTLPSSEEDLSVLTVSLPLHSFKTLYAHWGDRLILSCSVFFLLIYCVTRFLFLKVWIGRFSFRESS